MALLSGLPLISPYDPVLGWQWNELVALLTGKSSAVAITIGAAITGGAVTPGSITPDAFSGQAPGIPTGLTLGQGLENVSQTNKGFINATWNANTDHVSSYEVQWRVNGDTQYYRDVVGTNSKKIGSLIPGTTYAVSVRAFNDIGNPSAYSAEVTIGVGLDTTAPAVPTGLAVYGAPHGAFYQFNANTEPDLQGYLMQYQLGADTDSGTATSVGITTLADTGKAWTVNAYAGLWVTSGGKTAKVLSNTATVLTVDFWRDATPSVTTYVVASWKEIDLGPSLQTSGEFINPNAPNVANSNVSVKLRVGARDWTGNTSSYSASQTASTSGLSFSEMLVGNITVLGTLTGSGGIQTGSSGARTQMLATGFFGYNSGGTQTIAISATDGSFTFTGAGSLFSLAVGSANNIFKADTNGIYLGNATFGSAPFSVSMTGALVATSASITGTITSSTIIGGTIQIGTVTNQHFKADTNGIYLGNDTFASAPFRVNMTGDLVASSATITGVLTASTVTGTNIVARIAAQVLGADTAYVEFTSIGQNFTHLKMEVSARSDAGVKPYLNVQMNGDTGANYYESGIEAADNAAPGSLAGYGTTWGGIGRISQQTSAQWCATECTFFEYSNATKNKSWVYHSWNIDGGAAGDMHTIIGGGLWNSSTAITTLRVTPQFNGLKAGSTIRLWGIP